MQTIITAQTKCCSSLWTAPRCVCVGLCVWARMGNCGDPSARLATGHTWYRPSACFAGLWERVVWSSTLECHGKGSISYNIGPLVILTIVWFGFLLCCDHKNLIFVCSSNVEIKRHVRGKLKRWVTPPADPTWLNISTALPMYGQTFCHAGAVCLWRAKCDDTGQIHDPQSIASD